MTRTFSKGLVELGTVMGITVLSWAIDNAASLDAPVWLLGFLLPAALTARRMLRDRLRGTPV